MGGGGGGVMAGRIEERDGKGAKITDIANIY